jgi:uncharacterized membrane protein YqgA involved in biofilm formation
MIALVINALAIVIGAMIGLLFKRFIKKEVSASILKGIGIVVLIFAILGVIVSMIVIENEKLASKNEILLLISITIGTLIGESLKLDKHLDNFGKFVERKLNKSHISEALVSSSLIFCVGALAIIGSIEAAFGNYDILLLKALIDGITAMILATTLGYGVMLSGVIVFLYQGLIIILALMLGSFMSPEVRDGFSMVGYTLVACLALNFIREEKIKVVNMLPSLLIILFYYLIF